MTRPISPIDIPTPSSSIAYRASITYDRRQPHPPKFQVVDDSTAAHNSTQHTWQFPKKRGTTARSDAQVTTYSSDYYGEVGESSRGKTREPRETMDVKNSARPSLRRAPPLMSPEIQEPVPMEIGSEDVDEELETETEGYLETPEEDEEEDVVLVGEKYVGLPVKRTPRRNSSAKEHFSKSEGKKPCVVTSASVESAGPKNVNVLTLEEGLLSMKTELEAARKRENELVAMLAKQVQVYQDVASEHGVVVTSLQERTMEAQEKIRDSKEWVAGLTARNRELLVKQKKSEEEDREMEKYVTDLYDMFRNLHEGPSELESKKEGKQKMTFKAMFEAIRGSYWVSYQRVERCEESKEELAQLVESLKSKLQRRDDRLMARSRGSGESLRAETEESRLQKKGR